MITRSKAAQAPSARSGSSASSATARRLAAQALHARRLADADNARERAAAERERAAAERERVAAEREHAVAQLELEAELAAIDSSARSSRTSVENWLATQDSQANIDPAQVAPEIAASPAPIPAPLSRDRPMATPEKALGLHPRYVAQAEVYHQPASTSNPHLHITHNKVLPSNNAHTTSSDLRMLAEVITDLAGVNRYPKVCEVKLPPFDSRVTDWLPFRGAFDETKGGFTVPENVFRFNTAIRGAARNFISTLPVSARVPEGIGEPFNVTNVSLINILLLFEFMV